MTAREFRDWQLFEAVQPLPDKLADLHSALLCVVASNIMRSNNSEPAKLEDFLILKPRPEPETAPADDDETKPAAMEADAFRRMFGRG